MKEEGLRRSPIQVRPSPIAGRGVFAGRAIREGALIEECPILAVSDVPADLSDFVIRWESGPDVCALPLGYGAVYNHSDDPNATWETDLDRSVMVIWAARDIAEDEEILISYGPRWFGDRDLPQR